MNTFQERFGKNEITSPKQEGELEISALPDTCELVINTRNSRYMAELTTEGSERHIFFKSGTGPLVGYGGRLLNTSFLPGRQVYFEGSNSSPVTSVELLEGDDSNREKFEHQEGDEKIEQIVPFLSFMDHYVEGVSVDPHTGHIEQNAVSKDLLDPAIMGQFEPALLEAWNSRSEKSAQLVADCTAHSAILDVKRVMGAVVVTCNSADWQGLVQVGPYSFPIPDPRGSRGARYNASSSCLSFVVVDINIELRTDNVTPTTSIIHELHHHTKFLTDYLLSVDSDSPLHSGINSSSARDSVLPETRARSSQEAYMRDAQYYSDILNRQFSPSDIDGLRSQHAHLDELHSSFLQHKPGWFSATSNVYTILKEGLHWELVGDNQEDQESTKRLLAYLQGFFIVKDMQLSAQRAVEMGLPIGEGQKRLIETFDDLYRDCGAVIGASRCVQQTERLIIPKWEKVRTEFSKLFQTTMFQDLLAKWEEGHAVENLRTILEV